MSKNIMQMCADEIAGYLKRIAELESELATQKERLKIVLEDFNEMQEENNKLASQVAVSEEENETFRKALQGEIFINYKIPMENERLKQQLAEKEKEIEELRLKERNIFPLLKNLEQKVDQDKTDFAIEQLEKVKQWCSKYEEDLIDYEDGLVTKVIGLDDAIYIAEMGLYDFIDQQIKELRGENV